LKKFIPLSLLLLLVFVSWGCDKGEPVTLTAFVGSASKPAMEEAAAAFEKETGIKVYLNFGGSGTMLSQIELSRSGDLYIPGSQDYIVKAEHKGVIDINSVEKIAYLIPVISVQHGNPQNIQTLADLARPGLEIGIGNPQSVCLGLYAIEIFEYNGLLDDIANNIVVNAESCAKTAALISLQSVDAVIGWDVFHYWDSENIDTVYIDASQLPRLAYVPGAITKFTKDKENACRFLDFLVSEEGRQIFQKWGYITTEEEARVYAPDAEIGGEYALPASYQP
jgi:molybdate transport system substrate-binding protein